MKILVMGAGLIGASIGLSARQVGHSVELRDIDAQSTQRAQTVTSLGDKVSEPDLIVVAVPSHLVGQVVIEAIRSNPNSIVIDVASVKTEVINQVETEIGKNSKFVPTHPMAGKESSGAHNASFDLFQDRIWVMTPMPYTDEIAIDTVNDFIKECGATPVILESVQHDATVALTSHVPQVLSTLLAAEISKLNENAINVSGAGLRDMTRLAASNAELWTGIVNDNSQHIVPILNSLTSQLQEFSQSIANADVKRVRATFEQGNAGRRKIPGKHGSPESEYTVVSIMIDDKPGQLAAIFNTAGIANINIEDVNIDHSLGKAQAIIELFVRPEVADNLTDAMRQDGWIVRSSSLTD